ncbi:leucine-rich repeat domain-containing protein [Paenibacillus xylanexedens]|uniref:leucine-rich repeat domain-containing protein n=1 Tax=Paenibacillus xylanexedens TaxID=528191 RepID=UPI001F3DCABE|nr:leucine-rich repeat domain-containing protein [Paenibacillus xylanexedens]MCF7758341.1 leucine-rich repeat domain-containing protein [Paenibacillus xylanexedens]
MRNQFIKSMIALCLVFVLLPTTIISAASLIKDPVLAKVIRADLKMSAKKEIKVADLKKLKSIYAMETKSKISNLQGLEHAVNMTDLVLPGHNVKNITPLTKLKKLEFLALDGNQITDLSPISGLKNLQTLFMDDNKIKSLTPLKNMHKLTSLLASGNQVTDLSPLQKLKLEWVIMNGNKIQDLTPLNNHPTLEYLYVEDNLIEDIAVLETIPHLTEVYLANNPLNERAEQVVKNLEKKGVVVSLVSDEEGQASSFD